MISLRAAQCVWGLIGLRGRVNRSSSDRCDQHISGVWTNWTRIPTALCADTWSENRFLLTKLAAYGSVAITD